MRASRLVTLLLLLQTRGRMTAAQLATELEGSERTVHPDADAVSAAGAPTPGARGPPRRCRGARGRRPDPRRARPARGGAAGRGVSDPAHRHDGRRGRGTLPLGPVWSRGGPGVGHRGERAGAV